MQSKRSNWKRETFCGSTSEGKRKEFRKSSFGNRKLHQAFIKLSKYFKVKGCIIEMFDLGARSVHLQE